MFILVDEIECLTVPDFSRFRFELFDALKSRFVICVHQTFICSKLTIEALEKGMKHVQN